MNRKMTTGAPQLHPISVHSPWHMIGIDFIGPLSPPADDGSRYSNAIAFATALCDGVNPHGLSLHQRAMHEHLVGCFEEGEMLPFPHSSSARRISRRRIKRVEKVAVYCSCRLPWDRLDTSFGSQYRKCKQWF